MTSGFQLADFVRDAVVAADEGQRITYWNPAATTMFGWTAHEAIGHPAFELLREVFPDARLDDVLRVVESSGGWTGAVSQIAKDGHTVICEASIARLPAAMAPHHYIVVLRDLSGHRQAEERLSTALTFNSAVIAASLVGILTYRLTGACASCNPAAAVMIGASEDILRSQNFRGLASWRESGLLDLAEKAIATRERQTADIEITTTFGRTAWFVARCQLIRYEGEERLLLILSDITERKRTEAELHKLSRVVEQSPASIVMTDPTGAIEYVNAQFTAASGYTLADVKGRNPRILRSGETKPEIYQSLWQTIIAGGTWRGEFHNRRKGGELYWERATIFPLLDAEGTTTQFVAVKEDISAQKAAEQEAGAAEARFQKAQKMEAIGQLAGGIAHDFNNILSVIIGYTEILALDVRDAEMLDRDIREIHAAAERAAGLTRQLLAFSRHAPREARLLNLNEVITGVSSMLRRVLSEDVAFRLDLPEDLPAVAADPAQIEQILLNLTVNARDAMPDGGALTIETGHVYVDAAHADASRGIRAGAHVTLRVADTGCGMDAATKARVFEPFFTTKPPGRGTGLGLASVFGIVKQSGGSIWVESEPGCGTAFTIHLPVVAGQVERAPVPATSVAQAKARETVLVVEDSDPLRTLTARMLRGSGYTVLEAADGTEALKVSDSHEGPIHLLVSDLVMPGMNGRELATAVVARRPDIRVLFVSGYSGHTAVAGRIGLESAPFLQKPFGSAQLTQKVWAVLHGSKPS